MAPPQQHSLLAALVLSLVVRTHADASAASRGGGGGLPFDLDARTRGYWQEATALCPDRRYVSCNGMDRSGWSNATTTRASQLRFAGLAAWSWFTLETHDAAGTRRTRGGDSWYIVLKDPHQHSRVPTRVFDEGNGTYTVAITFLRPGNYSLVAWLWYSNCHALQEPFPHFHKQLNKSDHCYVGDRLRIPHLFQVPRSELTPNGDAPCVAAHRAPAAAGTCPPAGPPAATTHLDLPGLTFRTETYFYRQSNTVKLAPCCRRLRLPPARRSTSRLLVHGDSTSRYLWILLMHMARRPCKPNFIPRTIFESLGEHACPSVKDMAVADPELDAALQRCTAGLPWTTVPVGANTIEISKYYPTSLLFNMSDFKYNDTFARNHTPPVQLPLAHEFTVVFVDGYGCPPFVPYVLPNLKPARSGDVLVVNMGAHCTRSMGFDEWRRFVDAMVVELVRLKDKGVPLIWRTSFMIKENVFRSGSHAGGYIPQAHFHTDARRQLFDSYVEAKLAPAGIHIWDVSGLTSMGDFKKYDMIHADAMTVWGMVHDLMDLFACPSEVAGDGA